MKSVNFNRMQLVLWAALSLVLPAVAQEKSAKASGRLPLWKIEGKTNSLYLLGSIHILNQTNYPLAAPIESAFSNAQVVAFETDISEMNSMETQVKIAFKGMLPEGETLKDRLTPETYAELIDGARKAGVFEEVPQAMFVKLKPFMAAMTLLAMEMKKMNLDPKFGVDQHFHKKAKAAGKKIVPLETLDFQIEMLTGFPKEDDEPMVKSTIKEKDTISQKLGDLVKAWETGDEKALDELLNEASKDAPAMMKRLLTDRNHNWMPKIEGMMRDGKNTIVIVGAAHLVGKEGVVELLRKKGLKVTQL